MYFLISVILFFLVLSRAYFVLDTAIKNQNEGMKVFGAVLFSFLLVIACGILFYGIFLLVTHGQPPFLGIHDVPYDIPESRDLLR